MDRFTFDMINALPILAILFLIVGCGQRTENKPEIILSKEEIEFLLTDWKTDSMGCLRTRDPEKMKIYAKQLIGLDSIELIEKLGPPNHVFGYGERRQFSYFLECGRGKTSYYNFYFQFYKDTVEAFSNPVH